MKGMKVLGVGKWQNKRLETLGQVPVSMGPMDILPSLQTGVIDNGPNGTMIIALDFGFIDYLPYWTHVQTESIPLIIGVNLDAWNGLPADIREILDGMVPWTTELWDKMWVDAEHELYPIVESKATEIYTPPAEELARWDALDKPVWDEYAEEMESMGLPGRALMDDYITLEKKYSIPLSEWSP
jgi:TRAP-type C4-dicarboxylate transport system substrate-binding protein